MARYISHMGYVYRLTPSAWTRLMRSIAAGREWELSRRGIAELGPIRSVTDMGPDEARELLGQEDAPCD